MPLSIATRPWESHRPSVYLGFSFVKWKSDRKGTVIIINWIISLPCLSNPPKAFHFSKLFTLTLKILMALNIFHFYPHQYSLITLISFLAFEYTKLLPFGGFALAVSLSKTLLFSLRSQLPPQFKSFLFHLGHPPYTSLFYFTQSTHHTLIWSHLLIHLAIVYCSH